MDDLINWIHDNLEERGWTYADIAHNGGISKSMISRVISGQSKPGLDFCHALAQLTTTDQRQQLTIEIERTRARIEELDRQRNRLALALAAGNMDPEIYHTTDTQLRKQQEQQSARLIEHSRTLNHLPDLDDTRAALSQLAPAFPLLVQHAEPAELATLLQRAGVRILIENNQVHEMTP